ncbi:MAG: hypothetical protein M3R30_02185 [Candidatus Eremiobacteraeota bacterium]|nr:hypothetical protein [Candidatus Eremiobacteraeota bacterium]
MSIFTLALSAILATATAAPAPSPTLAPTPIPAHTASPRFTLHGSGANLFLSQATHGPGTAPPEGGAFAAGEPIAPVSPYDWFSTAPLIPGNAGELQYLFTGSLHMRSFSFDATVAMTRLAGSSTALAYWGEPFPGRLDPHEGRSPIGGLVVFPTHAGANDVEAAQIVLPYSASIHPNDDAWRLSAGFVDPIGFDPFVFTPPAVPSVAPALGIATFESLGPGAPALDGWVASRTTLPLLGVDATATIGHLSYEFTDALMPAPMGNGVRMTGGSIALDRGDLGRFSFDLVHVVTSGDPATVPALFGSAPQLHPGPQGPLATSLLGDQRQTIAGLRTLVHPRAGYDLLAELGRSWYDAELVARPGTAAPGVYEHLSLVRHANERDEFGLEYYRDDPRYGTTLLPYGTAENLWGTAWAFPGSWLKGAYQLVADNVAQTNRAGLRFHATSWHKRFEARVALSAYRQLEPSSMANLTQTGFVEVQFLPQADADTTLGRVRSQVAYAAWHFDRDLLSLDFARDTLRRGVRNGAAVDFVDMRYPQLVIQDRHVFSPRLIGVVGYGRYAAGGTWTTTPVEVRYATAFAGAELDFGNGRQLFAQLRTFGLNGMPSIPGGPPPTFRGTAFTLEHRIAF